jgi:hypothetical protein
LQIELRFGACAKDDAKYCDMPSTITLGAELATQIDHTNALQPLEPWAHMGATAGTYEIKCCAVGAQKAEDSAGRGYHVVS